MNKDFEGYAAIDEFSDTEFADDDEIINDGEAWENAFEDGEQMANDEMVSEWAAEDVE